MPQVQVDGLSVWYGDGAVPWREEHPLVVLLHGAGSDHTVWAKQSRALGQHGWNVAAVDLPGHGRSADADGCDTIEGQADWLGRFLDVIGVERVAVVGHSMGACLALTFAARYQGRILALALLGAGNAMAVNPQLLELTLEAKPRADAFIAAYGHGRGAHLGMAREPGVWLVGATLALLKRCPSAILHRDFAACNNWSGDPLAAAVTCPTMVISGDADRMTPPKSGQALAKAIAGARHEIIPNIGHMLMAEAPGAVTHLLRGFMEIFAARGYSATL